MEEEMLDFLGEIRDFHLKIHNEGFFQIQNVI